MTSKLKCPFCGQKLLREYNRDRDTVIYHCDNCYFQGDGIIWQALTQAKQDLKQSERCCSAWETQALDYKAETIALSGKLEIARKALKNMMESGGDGYHIARQALEQIEHKVKDNE